jgi:glyoxylate reductase
MLEEVIGDASGLLSMLTDRIDAALLDRAPRLRVISQMAVGVDNIDLEACRGRGLIVGHTPDVLTETTADTAFALLAAAVRRLPEGWDHVRSGSWGEWKPDLLLGGDLHGTTLGIVGLGRIGQAVARRAHGFGMRLLYAGRSRKPAAEAQLAIAYRPFPELLAESDHVVVTASYDDSNHRLFDRDAFGGMKEGATFVNVARGGLVDHEALAGALSEGWIGRAALDVTDPEPIPAGHPLVGLPNCLIVPHIGSASHRTRLAMARLAVDNLLAGLEGRTLPAALAQVQAVG